MTNKTARFLAVVSSNPGINALQVHAAIGSDYAHGHHKYSYETIARMLRNGLVKRGASANGRGKGLYATA